MKAKTADSSQGAAKGAVLVLPAEMKINNNRKLLEKLKSVLERGYSKITLDLGKINNADLSSLQIILSFYKECLLNDLQIEFKGPLKESFSTRLLDSGFLERRDFSEVLFPFMGKKGAEIGNR